MSRCYIVGAAPCAFFPVPQKDDFLIAADAGLKTLEDRGIRPDLLMGDFDSYTGSLPNLPALTFPVRKDDTDSALAVQEGLRRGCESFLLVGCLGGALDHTLANLALLANLAEDGKKAIALDGKAAVTAICNRGLFFPAGAQGRISVFSHSDVSSGVRICGLSYGLENGRLIRQVALGVSNHFIGQSAQISVQRGTLLIHTDWENLKNAREFVLDP